MSHELALYAAWITIKRAKATASLVLSKAFRKMYWKMLKFLYCTSSEHRRLWRLPE